MRTRQPSPEAGSASESWWHLPTWIGYSQDVTLKDWGDRVGRHEQGITLAIAIFFGALCLSSVVALVRFHRPVNAALAIAFGMIAIIRAVQWADARRNQ